MKEKFATLINRSKAIWAKQSRKQKTGLFIAIGIIAVVVIVIVALSSHKNYVPLYSNLSESETGQIKDNLDSKGVPYKIEDGGTMISVPKEQVDTLKVELASEGLPKTGQIDYSTFSENTQFGMTDKQFDVLNKAAMETELSNLIKGISGVKSAQVMLNLPEQDVWVSDDPEKASASIVLTLDSGYQLKDEQIEGLYHLASKSVPNLPEDNIVIMDQYFNYYDQKNLENSDSTLSAYQQQQQVKNDIEKDIQQRVQQMLGMMMGTDKVMVNVTSDIDFTKEKSKEELVEPVDKDTMDGLKVSTEHITESYKGDGAAGNVGTGDSQVPTYEASDGGESGDYEHVEDRVNNVFNHITNDIEKSPYKINDLGIQVMVEPPKANDPSSLTAQSSSDIKQILNTIIKTTLSDSDKSLTQDELDAKSVVTVEQFHGKQTDTPVKQVKKPTYWIYIAAGILALIIIVLLIILLRRRNQDEDIEEYEETTQYMDNEPDLLAEMQKNDSPEKQKKVQLETLARDNPTEFAKLLRTWFSEE
ncbi:flagellar M-ring protein FliF [Pullulanibacillus pueri]|uniref:Flagellar M-ring protein n=1 Tax=Pullulanibacillus pueri TaxID=1437324 RepID=A0A8J2ZWB3_9BACL|nr:flagellar basal-body MS-ring/collar protein FliF [Pullulanibacillus pueri]MBM7682474.1 flagellar M-ring protein FliF [Pullulanibacillus pueri]GGH82254.1 flagellar M-ring protein [Pullulanibacillus pueri]